MMPAIFATQPRRKNGWRCCGSFHAACTNLRRNALLNRDFIDILSAFSKEKVDYIVVGGYAIAFHGFVRGTGDIDLWIRNSNENTERVWAALKAFGAPLSDLSINDLQTPGMVFQMGLPPNRIDIINRVEGLQFEEAWPNRTFVELHELTIPIAGKPELLKNKRAMNRPKDMADIIWLENI
jgi:hypothetical protein